MEDKSDCNTELEKSAKNKQKISLKEENKALKKRVEQLEEEQRENAANLRLLIKEIREGFQLVMEQRPMQEEKNLQISRLQKEVEELKHQMTEIENNAVKEREQTLMKDELIQKLKDENAKVIAESNQLKEGIEKLNEKRKLELIEVERMKMVWDFDIAQAADKFEAYSKETESKISSLKNEVSNLKKEREESEKNNRTKIETLTMKVNEKDQELESIKVALQLKTEELNEIFEKKKKKKKWRWFGCFKKQN